MTANTLIPTLDHSDSIPAYIATPKTPPRGAIIVIQEIFGVNPGIRKKADHWAELGYLAIAPDIFWRQQAGVEFDPDRPEEFQQAVGFMMKHDFALGLQDIKAVIAWARHSRTIAKVGLIGFCMGGKIAYMAATQTDIDAAVGYYGVGIDQMLNAASAITKPLLLHIPTHDGFVTPDAQQAMHQGLDSHPHVTLYDYPGLDHGFADTFGQRRNEAGAHLADQRSTEFFAHNIG